MKDGDYYFDVGRAAARDSEVDPETSTNDGTSTEANDNHYNNYDNHTIKKLGRLATSMCRSDWKYVLTSKLGGLKKTIAMEVQQLRTKRRNHDDDNRQEQRDKLTTPTPTPTLRMISRFMKTVLAMEINHADGTSTTGISQQLEEVSITASKFSLQNVYAEFVEEEIQRSGELIMANRMDGSPTSIPTWQELTTATDMGPINALLTALAYGTDDDDPWAILGLSRLEGPKPD